MHCILGHTTLLSNLLGDFLNHTGITGIDRALWLVLIENSGRTWPLVQWRVSHLEHLAVRSGQMAFFCHLLSRGDGCPAGKLGRLEPGWQLSELKIWWSPPVNLACSGPLPHWLAPTVRHRCSACSFHIIRQVPVPFLPSHASAPRNLARPRLASLFLFQPTPTTSPHDILSRKQTRLHQCSDKMAVFAQLVSSKDRTGLS